MYASRSRRVLVVEDDALLAWELQDLLSGHGYEVIGPIGRLPILLHYLQQTLPDAAGDAAIDAAILDVTIDGGLVFPAADMLARVNIPFAFVSGHARGMIPALHRDRPLLNKPISPPEIVGAVAQMLETLGTAQDAPAPPTSPVSRKESGRRP